LIGFSIALAPTIANEQQEQTINDNDEKMDEDIPPAKAEVIEPKRKPRGKPPTKNADGPLKLG
jgi:hypothetical protein